MGSRISTFIQNQFQIPTLLPTPTFSSCLQTHHHLRLPSFFTLSKTTKAVTLIITNETLEKMCSIGAGSLLTFFLKGSFNLPQDEVVNINLLFSGITNFVPIVGAILSDSFFGRFKTLAFSTPCSMVAAVLLMVTALSGMHPRQNPVVEAPKAWQMTVVYASLFFFTLAAAGIRSCNLPFGIDQYDLTTEAGRRGKERFINWNYASFTLSVLAALIIIPIVQAETKSWVVGFLIPACFMLFSCILFFAGAPLYVKLKPQGSPVVSLLQVFVASFRNRKLPLPSNPNQLFSHPSDGQPAVVTPTNHLRFLEKAAILPAVMAAEEEGEITTEQQQPWKLCSIEQVEEAKSVVKVIVMWTPAIVYQMVAAELQNHGGFQALSMDGKVGRKFKLPAASMGVFSAVALTAWVTVYDKVIIPVARQRRSSGSGQGVLELSTLQRMGIGMSLSTLAAAVAGIVEGRRRRSVKVPSVFWLVPQLVLMGLAEGFNSVAQIEFYHTELPARMSSLTGAFFAMGYSFGSFAAWLLDKIVSAATRSPANAKINWLSEKGGSKLDHHYFVVAGLAAINLAFFLFLAKRYKLAPAAN